MTSTLWLGLTALVVVACGTWLIRDIQRQVLPGILVFVVLALFFRFVLSAFHTLTFPAIIGPFSINALYSILVIGCGLLAVDARLLRLKFLLPVYSIIVIVVLSAIANGTFKESIETVLKWLFFIVIALGVYESALKVDRAIVLEKLLKAFSVPLCLQLLAVISGYSKRSESDGSISYVGGFHHEAVFSVILCSALVLAALLELNRLRVERSTGTLPLIIAVGVMFTNYRTNILAMLLPLTGYVYFRFVRGGAPLTKVVAMVGLAGGACGVALMDMDALILRFSEIGEVVGSVPDLIKAPVYYTEWEQDYFSARVYLWSQYLDAYVNAGSLQHLIGHGADSWPKLFAKYAHNTFVSYLFEVGLLGVLALLYLFFRNMARCFHGVLTTYSLFLFLSFTGFLIMNLGTMPLWQVEGVALFAMLNALVWERLIEYSPRGRATMVQEPTENAPARAAWGERKQQLVRNPT